MLFGSGVVVPGPAAAATETITVYAGGGGDDRGEVPALLFGANHRYTFDGYGVWDAAAGAPVPDVVAKARAMGMSLLRWPGGTVGNTVWWKGTIGQNRMCQRDGRASTLGVLADPADDVLPARSPSYGLDEHMRFAAAVGAETQVMVPMTIGNPFDAADLVEYLNTPSGDGVNPNGDIDWAEVRKANGHPEPYRVTHFELGNEHYLANQRYWMAQNTAGSPTPVKEAITQYINGGTRRITGAGLGKLTLRDAAGNKLCTGSTAAVPSDGTPGQIFNVTYPSVVVGTFTLRVGGTTWRRVDSLDTAGPTDRVYTLRPHIGEVAFGDGRHGAIPPSGASVVADYTSTHLGFVDFYRKMKAVDPKISVCATWGAANFPDWFRKLAPAGSRYDCLAMHPYTNFKAQGRADWDSPLEAHDWHMLSAWDQSEQMVDVRGAVDAHTGTPHPYVAVSEYGALWGPDQDNPFPEYAHSMTHALYMATQWISWLEMGIPWALGNDFSSHGWYTLLGPPNSGFVYSAEAVAREAVKPMFESRGSRIRHSIAVDSMRDPSDTELCDANAPARCREKYHKLWVTATRDPAGAVYLMVVNRSPTAGDAVTARVVVNGFTGNGTAEVRQVAPADFTAHNDAQTPNAVTMARSTVPVDANGFNTTFPPYSITLLKLPRA
ncbi:alpha-L-arabinofuranosidase C-terminal domain-containing protein [Plantactinospora sp. B6F1]|uniref:alpha-L-arabinofuranosidase C-terminal domain-containing protein n=1 Tax=Plantactinospora sp. B6F1 TaxID=3158971 RepID=UPI0032D9259F